MRYNKDGDAGRCDLLDLCDLLLETVNLPDDQPQIEAPTASVTYISNFDTNFEDNKAFITLFSEYLEEADALKGLVSMTSDSFLFDIKYKIILNLSRLLLSIFEPGLNENCCKVSSTVGVSRRRVFVR